MSRNIQYTLIIGTCIFFFCLICMIWILTINKTQYWLGNGNFETDYAECSSLAGQSIAGIFGDSIRMNNIFDSCMIGRNWKKSNE